MIAELDEEGMKWSSIMARKGWDYSVLIKVYINILWQKFNLLILWAKIVCKDQIANTHAVTLKVTARLSEVNSSAKIGSCYKYYSESNSSLSFPVFVIVVIVIVVVLLFVCAFIAFCYYK